MKRAVVLAGGGSKGAYEVGAVLALKKIGIKYSIITGTSVGALNAALFTQRNYKKGVKLWANLDFNSVIDEPIIYDEISRKVRVNIIRKYGEAILKGGMGITALEKNIKKIINVNKVYKSKIDMGLVTVNAKTLEPLELTKKQIKKEHFIDYLIASASCFPAFKMKKIEDNYYIDGGYHDNLPINLAINMGAEEIIAIDLCEVGRKRRTVDKKVKVITISPSDKVGSFLLFDKKFSNRLMKCGYNDAMKTFGKLDGNIYSFKNKSLSRNYNKYYMEFKKLIEEKSNFFQDLIYKNILSERYAFKYFNKMIEKLGIVFDIDITKVYTMKKFNKLLISNFNNLEYIKTPLFSDIAGIKYLYDSFDEKGIKFNHYILIHPNLFIMSAYLKIIIENDNKLFRFKKIW